MIAQAATKFRTAHLHGLERLEPPVEFAAFASHAWFLVDLRCILVRRPRNPSSRLGVLRVRTDPLEGGRSARALSLACCARAVALARQRQIASPAEQFACTSKLVPGRRCRWLRPLRSAEADLVAAALRSAAVLPASGALCTLRVQTPLCVLRPASRWSQQLAARATGSREC